MDRKRVEDIFVKLIVAHSVGVGILLTFAPRFALRFAGWPTEGIENPVFFVVQGGVFHFVVAAGYIIEYRRHGTVSLMIAAKGMASVFLLVSSFVWPGVWSIPLSAVSDMSMGVAAILVPRWARKA